jgi:HD superfamily phosphodiesterase
MKRINQLLHHPDFTGTINRLETLEHDRIYCRHGLSHLLDTARIATLLQYQDIQTSPASSPEHDKAAQSIDLELIYAAALLHDIGRVLQYEQNLPHETAGLPLAEKILKDCDFTVSEQALILNAILFHRSTDTSLAAGSSAASKEDENIKKDADRLRTLLHAADKLSRNCFACKASDSCYWPESKKNQGILF